MLINLRIPYDLSVWAQVHVYLLCVNAWLIDCETSIFDSRRFIWSSSAGQGAGNSSGGSSLLCPNLDVTYSHTILSLQQFGEKKCNLLVPVSWLLSFLKFSMNWMLLCYKCLTQNLRFNSVDICYCVDEIYLLNNSQWQPFTWLHLLLVFQQVKIFRFDCFLREKCNELNQNEKNPIRGLGSVASCV